MADRDKELKLRLSMLLDGELDGRDNPRLIERIEHDEDLKQTWARYNLIGQAMRKPAGKRALLFTLEVLYSSNIHFSSFSD